MTHKLLPFTALATLMLGGCIDSNYDLSNIDTTSEVKVVDLTLPVNIDQIVLEDVLDLDSDSKLKVVNIDGEEFYAFVEEGSFQPDDIHVSPFSAAAPHIDSTHELIGLKEQGRKKTASGSLEFTYEIARDAQHFSYTFDKIPDEVVSASSITAQNCTFDISLNLEKLKSMADRIVIRDLVLTLPKGFVVTVNNGTYDEKTGQVRVPEIEIVDGKADLVLNVKTINFSQNSKSRRYKTASGNTAWGFDSDIVVESGEVQANSSMELPAATDFNIDYNLSDIDVDTFSGDVAYDIDGMDINDISLNDLPSVIDESETSLILENPQIYLTLDNMVSDYGIGYNAGVKYSAMYNGEEGYSYSLDNNAEVKVTTKYGSGPYNFVLSPSNPTHPLSDYSGNLEFVKFSGLSNIVAGDAQHPSIPDALKVEITNPRIPQQSVKNFPLGKDIHSEELKYEFFAPLSLSPDSYIIYTKKYEGWNDEDVDAITISSLTIHTSATSTLPLNADIVAYPMDKDGNVINDVKVSGNILPAMASDYEMTLVASGEIRHLDGVKIVATIKSERADVITPKNSIVLKNVRAKVNGSYTKEL